MTAATIAQPHNPPLPFTKDAIINRLRHQATNGPAYVQHSATKALARLKGLYDEARFEARAKFETARDAAREASDQATGKITNLAQQLEDIRTGRTPVTAEMLGDYAIPVGDGDEQEADDEDRSTNAEDEPP